MIEVAAQRGKALRIVRAGADARDLQRFIPIRIENEDSHEEAAVGLILAFDSNGIPCFLCSLTQDTLAHSDPE